MKYLLELLEEQGARIIRRAPGHLVARWRGVLVCAIGDAAEAARRLRPAFDALQHLPDPLPVAEIELTRSDERGSLSAQVPVVTLEEGRAVLTLAGDSFLLILDRESGDMTVIGEDGAGAPIELRHHMPKATLGTEHGLAAPAGALCRRSSTEAQVSSTPASRHQKMARIRPLLRCVRCQERAPLGNGDELLRCLACGAEFPIVDGTPILLPSGEEAPRPQSDEVSSNPYSRQARALFERHADGLVLDCGSGYPVSSLPQVVHLEIVKYPNVDVVASCENMPFEDGTFDAAVCESVLEHVPHPWRVTEELFRVLKPGAAVRIDVPFLAPFHAYPNHYWNFTQSGLEQLLERFERIDGGIGPHQEPWLALAWILRLAREGLGDDGLRARFDGASLGDVLSSVANGKPSEVLHPLDDKTRRSIAAGFFYYGRKPE